MGLADGDGYPLAVTLHSASPHESTLLASCLDAAPPEFLPPLLIADKAYDSDPLDAQTIAEFGVELIAPHKQNRRAPKTQDGRRLRRYKKRWKIERMFAWFDRFRRLLLRWERKSENFLAFVQLACSIIVMRRVLG